MGDQESSLRQVQLNQEALEVLVRGEFFELLCQYRHKTFFDSLKMEKFVTTRITAGQLDAHRRLILVPILLVLISAALLSAWLTFLSLGQPADGPIGK